ncbi:hypothetical protein RchiOBHm_Chr1g0341361 [Rosa chinensis]|uniref:Uncharacterized protein n=1 Tax=Rosa chinensis TaxID=74649 RepID=A0A2P6SDQ6_ROSCH|nr:hypothetical protein RchiOBHm_Chr1g0341361 [Rosa chinensis]
MAKFTEGRLKPSSPTNASISNRRDNRNLRMLSCNGRRVWAC